MIFLQILIGVTDTCPKMVKTMFDLRVHNGPCD